VGGVARFERRALIQFSASEAFMAKVERVRSLAWHRLPANASLEQVFELALDCLIAHEDPAKRRERRQERERSIPARDPGTATTAVSHAHTPQVSAQQTRHIPAPVRDEVFVRDKGRCTYTGSNGQRCASTNALQIDHITPVARGGPSTPHNLRLLCAYHNRLEAERLMGCSGNRAGPPAR
jgi:5-methylcytosine-specific restriction endonuclease McrA